MPNQYTYSTVTHEQRFWSQVDKTETCWLWTKKVDHGGYGRFEYKESGRPYYFIAHRYAYALVVGPIPEGLQLDHLCRVRRCVNPSHLEPVTQRTNLLRGEGITAQEARRTTCPKGHPYSGRDRGGRRRCNTCQNERYRAKKLEQRSPDL